MQEIEKIPNDQQAKEFFEKANDFALFDFSEPEYFRMLNDSYWNRFHLAIDIEEKKMEQLLTIAENKKATDNPKFIANKLRDILS
jgi:hypothetical protein